MTIDFPKKKTFVPSIWPPPNQFRASNAPGASKQVCAKGGSIGIGILIDHMSTYEIFGDPSNEHLRAATMLSPWVETKRTLPKVPML